MGILNIFKKKEPTEADWKARFRKVRDGGSDKKIALGREYLDTLKEEFTNARYKKNSDGETDVELRAELNGVPFRIECKLYSGYMDIEIKCTPPGEGFDLRWDPKAVEKGSSDDDDWQDEDEDIRVSVGKNVFIEEPKMYIEERLGNLFAYPDEVIQKVIDFLQKGQLSWVFVTDDGIQLDPVESAYVMDLPVTKVKQIVAFGTELAQMLGGVTLKDGATSANGATEGVKLVKCNYCNARFNLAGRDRCAHCGAPHNG